MTGRLTFLAVALTACRGAPTSAIPEARADEPIAHANSTAVVELFTSEGCSSCPAAETALTDLERDNPALIALAFHVDYWDGLGWPDRFSSPEYTARQRDYAMSLSTSSLYTPQLIVSGTDAFPGGDRSRARESIAHALARPAALQVGLRSHALGADSVVVEVDAPGAPADAVVHVAIVQREATVTIGAGENVGRTLHHPSIVRAFGEAPPSHASVTLHVPSSLPRADSEIVAFVQRTTDDGSGMPILGAARTPLVP
jgi:hypothetical protein